MKLTLNNSDGLGALASTLCLIHCLITPFIFVVQSCAASCCASAPGWWLLFDYFFLTISFYAIFKSTKTTQSNFIKYSLWSFWFLLFCLIVNESFEVILINKMSYILLLYHFLFCIYITSNIVSVMIINAAQIDY